MDLTSEFFTGFTALSVLGVIGAALRFAWTQLTGRIDKRTKELDARERAFEEARDSRVRVLEADVQRLAQQLQKVTDFVGRQRSAIHLLVAKIAREEPTAPELILVEKLLGDEFPGFLRTDPPPAATAEQVELARQLDEEPRA